MVESVWMVLLENSTTRISIINRLRICMDPHLPINMVTVVKSKNVAMHNEDCSHELKIATTQHTLSTIKKLLLLNRDSEWVRQRVRQTARELDSE